MRGLLFATTRVIITQGRTDYMLSQIFLLGIFVISRMLQSGWKTCSLAVAMAVAVAVAGRCWQPRQDANS